MNLCWVIVGKDFWNNSNQDILVDTPLINYHYRPGDKNDRINVSVCAINVEKDVNYATTLTIKHIEDEKNTVINAPLKFNFIKPYSGDVPYGRATVGFLGYSFNREGLHEVRVTHEEQVLTTYFNVIFEE
ncbi:hypothetical protein QJ729_01905 [Staphylococcus hominis]|uniref:hypothetical protein n=1 Tax=Staphylococcus hominis TaxID=1290 RepID=UPI0034CEAB2F